MDNLTYPEWLRKLADALHDTDTRCPIYLCHIVDPSTFRRADLIHHPVGKLRLEFAAPYPAYATRLLATINILRPYDDEDVGLTGYFASLYGSDTWPKAMRIKWLRGLAVQAEEDAKGTL